MSAAPDIDAELAREKIRAEIAKLKAETDKIHRERYFYPAAASATVLFALAAVAKIFL